MATAGGPDIERDGLVFGYDTGYSSINENLSKGRYFKGPTSTNLLERLSTSYSNTQTSNFYAVAGEETVKIPKIGRRTVKYVEYFNNHPSSGNCCPNLFNYGEATVTPNTSYTYSIVYKHTGNYTHPNFMYRYEYNGGTYNTEGGSHSTASDRRRSLGDGWFHAWGTFTTQATTNRLICYSFLYNYGTTKYKFYVAAISIVRNTTGTSHLIVPPHLMLQPNTSISSTQSLIDLTRTTNIDLSNVSFDSTGQPIFDGTDDHITGVLPINGNGAPHTIEMVFSSNVNQGSLGSRRDPFTIGNSTTHQYSALDVNTSNMNWYFFGKDTSFTNSPQMVANQYYHIVLSYAGGFSNNTNKKVWINSVQQILSAGVNETSLLPNNPSFSIGRDRGRNTAYWPGKIPVFKVYNRALSQEEAQQNYNAYKNRFNL